MRALLILIALTSIASAQPPSLVPPQEPSKPLTKPRRVERYHQQTLIADGTAVGLVVLGASLDDVKSGESFAMLGMLTYAFGTPIVHLTKHRGSHAFVSLGLRIGLPLLGFAIGHSIDPIGDCDPEWLDCYAWSGPETVGALAGLAAVIAHDAIFLADGDDEPEAPPRVMPALRATQGGATVGIGGSF